MLTIKDVKKFEGLDQKAYIAEAATVGRNGSQGTVYGTMVSIALAAGRTAKAQGLKSYTFERAASAFATEYFAGKSDGSEKATISALGAWTEAGMHSVGAMAEVAVRVFNEKAKDGKTISLTSRAGMLRKLLKLDHEPSKKEYQDARPSGGNRTGEGTLKGASAALLRSVDGFGIKWLGKMKPADAVDFKTVRDVVAKFAAKFEEEVVEKPATKGKATAPTKADERKAMLAKLASLEMPKGHKTLQ